MRKLSLLLVGLCMSSILLAQETGHRNEVGLTFSDLNNFGLTYRVGNDNSLWRFNSLLINGSSTENSMEDVTTNQTNFGFGLKVGKEFRKELATKLDLRYGADLGFTYQYNKMENSDHTSERSLYMPGANLVLGVNYNLNDNLILGAEVLPSFTYTTGTSRSSNSEVDTDISGITYGFTSNSVLLSLVYSF